jgi:TonB family protein
MVEKSKSDQNMRQYLFIVAILLNAFQASGQDSIITTLLNALQTSVQDSKINANGEEIFHTATVQRKPRFPSESFQNSDNALIKFITDSLRYPDQALPNNIVGTVVVSFIVRKNGKLDEIKILRGLSKEIDDEAIRLIMSMPDWIPGMNNKIPVNTSYALPIRFRPRAYNTSELDIQPVLKGDINKLKKKLKRQLKRRSIENVSQAIVEINTKGEIVRFYFGVTVNPYYFESIMKEFSNWSPGYMGGKAVWCGYPLKLDE